MCTQLEQTATKRVNQILLDKIIAGLAFETSPTRSSTEETNDLRLYRLPLWGSIMEPPRPDLPESLPDTSERPDLPKRPEKSRRPDHADGPRKTR